MVNTIVITDVGGIGGKTGSIKYQGKLIVQ